MNCCFLKPKLQGFTILELLVGMVVSGIVLSGILAAYHIIQKQAISYAAHSEQVRDFSLGQSLFTRDKLTADSALYTGTSDVLFLKKEHGAFTTLATYSLYDSQLIRSTSFSTDTFFVSEDFHFSIPESDGGDQY